MNETRNSSSRLSTQSQLGVALEHGDLTLFNALLSFGGIRSGELRREHIGQAVSLAFANLSAEARYNGLFNLARGLRGASASPASPALDQFYRHVAGHNVVASFLSADERCLSSTDVGAVLLYSEGGVPVRAVCDAGILDPHVILTKIMEAKDLGVLSGFAVAEGVCGGTHQQVATHNAVDFIERVEAVANRSPLRVAQMLAGKGAAFIIPVL